MANYWSSLFKPRPMSFDAIEARYFETLKIGLSEDEAFPLRKPLSIVKTANNFSKFLTLSKGKTLTEARECKLDPEKSSDLKNYIDQLYLELQTKADNRGINRYEAVQIARQTYEFLKKINEIDTAPDVVEAINVDDKQLPSYTKASKKDAAAIEYLNEVNPYFRTSGLKPLIFGLVAAVCTATAIIALEAFNFAAHGFSLLGEGTASVSLSSAVVLAVILASPYWILGALIAGTIGVACGYAQSRDEVLAVNDIKTVLTPRLL